MNFKKFYNVSVCLVLSICLIISGCSKDQTIQTADATTEMKEFSTNQAGSQSKIFLHVLAIYEDDEDGEGMYAFCDLWGENFEHDTFRAEFDFDNSAGVVNNLIKQAAIQHLATDENIQALPADIIIFGSAQ